MEKRATANNPFLRRVLVPFLIIALPISAMIAWILYNKKANLITDSSALSVLEPVSFGTDNWPIFRGDPQLTGQAKGNLPNTLKLAWKYQTHGQIKSTPVIAKGHCYVSSLDKHIYKIDLQSGSLKWDFEADDELEAGPLYYDKTLYIGSNNGTVYAIDAENGQPKWTFGGAGKIAGPANIALLPESNLILIVFGSYDNYLYCLNTTTGTLIYKYPAESYINGAVAIDNDTAFFGSCDEMIYQIPLNDPNAAKTLDTGSYVAVNPVISNNVLYAGNFDGKFLAANITTQQILWTYKETQEAFFSSPAVNDSVVIVGCRDQNLYCFDKTDGTVRWKFSAGDNFDSSPVICGDKTVVGNDDGRLYIIDIQTGKEIFSYTLGSAIVSGPAVADNYCVIGCDNGTVYAFTAKD